MTLIEIENLPFAELKARYAELVKEAGGTDLAERFVAARMDAKQRDEKLSEQGRTINTLNDALDAAKQRIADVEGVVQKASAELLKQKESHAQFAAASESVVASLQGDITDLRNKLASEAARAERLKAEATRNFTALSTAEKTLKDAMAARELDTADKGE